MFGRKYDST